MNKSGKRFIEIIRAIVSEINEDQSIRPERRARITAFEICMMLDDTGEFGDGKREFKVVTMDGKPVKFRHHDL
jgi:hypothetical protein